MASFKAMLLKKLRGWSSVILGPLIEEKMSRLEKLERQLVILQSSYGKQSSSLNELAVSLQYDRDPVERRPAFNRGHVWAGSLNLGIGTDQNTGTTNPLEEFFDANCQGRGIWKWRHYFEIYHRHLERFRQLDRPLALAEVGVYSGGSLDMWRNYFGNQLIVHGVDLEDACKAYEKPGTQIHIGDQASREFWQSFRERVPKLDILIDDGGHSPLQQMVTLEEMLPHIQPGGLFICEDIHGLGNEFYLYVMGIVDQLNHYQYTHEEVIASTVTPVQSCYHSVHFYPYMVVIEKLSHARKRLLSEKRGTQWQPFLDMS